MAADPVAIAVRAYTTRQDDEPAGGSAARGRWSLPTHILAFDTETTTDYSQRLNFGSWCYLQADWDGEPTFACVEEGLFYADDLPSRDPAGYATLKRYAEEATPRVDRYVADAAWRMNVVSAREFAEDVLVEFGFRARAWIVGFNLPFDLSRCAYDSSESKGYLAGGFSLTLAQYLKVDGKWREHRWRNRVAIRTLDSKRHLIGFKRRGETDIADQIPEGEREPDPRYGFRGHFLDLRTLAFALTNESYSLEGAMQDFVDPDYEEPDLQHGVIEPRYIEYNRQDVSATVRLFEELLVEHRRHPIQLSPTKAYSPATIGKAYLRAMGVKPRLRADPDFPKEVLGQAMVAYYGGRAEARIRRTPLPVVYVDFLSMYPTVNSLMGLWQLVTARQVEVESNEVVTRDVQAMLDGLELEDCFDPNTWRNFVGLVEIEPDGDILPVRARYGDTASWGIGLNPLTSRWPLWYSIPDAVGSKLLTGRAPRIRRAIRIMPSGKSASLKSTSLRSAVSVDPREEDFFRAVIEQRHLLDTRTDLGEAERERLDPFLKVLANSASYGIYAEMIRHDIGRNKTEPVDVHGLKHFVDPDVGNPESPGEFAFPPMAACITGAARLMLTLLERRVSDVGGCYAFCDTDSMAIAANEHGGLVPCHGGAERLPDGDDAIKALSWRQVDEICRDFERLNPYNRDAIRGSVLEIEDENFEDRAREVRKQLYCYAISAKRYALYTLDAEGEPVLRRTNRERFGEKWSEHGLGHLLNPTDPNSDDRDWIKALWELELRRELGRPVDRPAWLEQPAVGQVSIGKPQTLDPFATFNRDKPYREQIKPFNFLLTAHLPAWVASPTDDALAPNKPSPTQRFQLISPYERVPDRWLSAAWRNKYADTDETYTVTTSDENSPNEAVRIQSYSDVLAEYRVHPEPKSRAPDGSRSGWHSIGLLQRRPVEAIRIVHIGKEANDLDDLQAGVVHDVEEVLNTHVTADEWRNYVLPTLGEMSRRELRELGLSGASIAAVRAARFSPTRRTKARLAAAAARFARGWLRDSRLLPPGEAIDACAAFVRARKGR